MELRPATSRGCRKEIALKSEKVIASGQIRDAFEKCVSPSFRRHNPYFKVDRESLLVGLENNAGQFADKIYEVPRAIEDGDLIAIHSRLKPKPDWTEMATVHIFRFDDDKIVEEWDLSQHIMKSDGSASAWTASARQWKGSGSLTK